MKSVFKNFHRSDSRILPEEQQRALRKAIRLEWMTIGWILVTVVLVGVVAGQSQAMRSAWFEDILSLVPPIAFLLASRITRTAPTREHPYGWHRAIAIAHQVAGLALLIMGVFLIYEAISALIKKEKPPIGIVVLFGHDIWSGWLMIGIMVVTSIPMVVFGYLKLGLSEKLHDKVLYADADMAKADWGTAAATATGVLGIGIGLWWADAAAALIISASIVKDGITNIKAAISGLSDARATTYDNSAPHPLTEEVESLALANSWVKQARARVRDQGHIFHTEMFVVPFPGHVPTVAETAQLSAQIKRLDWKLQDVVVVAVDEIDSKQVPPPR